MKKIALAAAFALAATNLSAGGMDEPKMESVAEPEMGKMAEPMMEPEVMAPDDNNSVLFPVMLLLLVAGIALT